MSVRPDVIWRESPAGEWTATAGDWELDVTRIGHRWLATLARHGESLDVEVLCHRRPTAAAARGELERLLGGVMEIDWEGR